MGRKIFISYKYADSNVHHIVGEAWKVNTVRDYVDELETQIKDNTDHIYKGESDGEDLSQLSENTIWEKLKSRIYDSTLTIIMISPNMKEPWKYDKDQWIPWEISYSLKETSRKNSNGDAITSKTNAILAIVLPDINNSYSYYTYLNNCCDTQCRHLETNKIFNIMKANMFNIKNPNQSICNNLTTVWYGDYSYIQSVKWSDFIENKEYYINKAYEIQGNIDNYKITKEV